MAEEGFGDRHQRNQRRGVSDDRGLEVVGQVRQDRNVLRLGRCQIRRRQRQHTAEAEEHHRDDHHAVSHSEDAAAFAFGLLAVTLFLLNRERGNDRRMVE
ncbi:hypothetical protein D3C78_1334700 [compost metagenome]